MVALGYECTEEDVATIEKHLNSKAKKKEHKYSSSLVGNIAELLDERQEVKHVRENLVPDHMKDTEDAE
jgi:hypothetical protein